MDKRGIGSVYMRRHCVEGIVPWRFHLAVMRWIFTGLEPF
jgi:hypothetical protein